MDHLFKGKKKRTIRKRSVFIVLFLILFIVIPLWFFAPYHHTERFITQEATKESKVSKLSSLIVDGNEEEKVSVDYGVVSKKEYIDLIFKLSSKDVFTDKWFLAFSDDNLSFEKIRIESIILNIDNKKYNINLQNEKAYQVIKNYLYFEAPVLAGTSSNEVAMILLPLPAIPKNTFNLTMSGTLSDNNHNKSIFSYVGNGIVTKRGHDWNRSDILIVIP